MFCDVSWLPCRFSFFHFDTTLKPLTLHNPLHAFMVNLTLHPKQCRDLSVSITKFMLTKEFTNLLYHVIFTWAPIGVLPAIVGGARKPDSCTRLSYTDFPSNGLHPLHYSLWRHLLCISSNFFSRSNCCFRNRFSACTFSSSDVYSGPLP